MKVLDHGHIKLIDSMGSDIDIVNAARTSFDNESIYHISDCPETSARTEWEKTKTCRDANCKNLRGTHLSTKDAGLINFLMQNRHGTPFEMVEVKFGVKAPIFVFREWHRHRIASINEMSGRYTELLREFYVPAAEDIREQKGKPGAYYYETIEDKEKAGNTQATIFEASDHCFDVYEDMLSSGIAKEVARLVLPMGTYSKMVWKTNLRAAMNFVSLRNHPHAQLEIRKYAEQMENILFDIAPIAMKSFVEHGRIQP